MYEAADEDVNEGAIEKIKAAWDKMTAGLKPSDMKAALDAIAKGEKPMYPVGKLAGNLEEEGEIDAEDLQKYIKKHKKEEKPESKDEEYNALQEQVKILSEKMKETNLINAKLLYVNKIMNENDLSAEQKIKVLNAFDQATTVKEAKLIHSSLSEAFKVKTAKPKTTNIKESLGFASKAAGTSTRKEIIAEADQQVSRWQKLAGIKLN
jgi:hypothetical protein